MRILWTLLKIVIALVIAVPLGIVALGLGLGILGTLLGLAVLALKLACVGFIGYGLFRAARYLFGAAPKPNIERLRELPQPDRYYQAAMRELDTHIGPSSNH
ncbi:MAG: hypothetical protein ABJE47_22075 [bacterium]